MYDSYLVKHRDFNIEKKQRYCQSFSVHQVELTYQTVVRMKHSVEFTIMTFKAVTIDSGWLETEVFPVKSAYCCWSVFVTTGGYSLR